MALLAPEQLADPIYTVFGEPGLFDQIVCPAEASEDSVVFVEHVASRVSKGWRAEMIALFMNRVWRGPFDARAAAYRASIDTLEGNGNFLCLIRGMDTYRGLFPTMCEEILAALCNVMHDTACRQRPARIVAIVAAGVLESTARIMSTFPVADAPGVCVQRNCVALLSAVLLDPSAEDVARAGSAGVYGLVTSTMRANPGHRELLRQGVLLLVQGFAHRTQDCVSAVAASMHAHCLDIAWPSTRAWRDALYLLSRLLETPAHLVLAGEPDLTFCPHVTVEHTQIMRHVTVETIVGGMHMQLPANAPRDVRVCCSIYLTSVTVVAQLAAVLDDAVTQSIVASGGIRGMLALLTSPRLSALSFAKWLHQDVCVALGFLGSSDATVQQRIVDEGGIAALEDVLVWRLLDGTTWHAPTQLCIERASLLLRRLRALG